ncbi:hypothetical protein [Peribacillus huizhouensis]|uniref:Glycosyltransferase n=1 Tax=Peribacillus huizhouensis TaxID=1501239 RepID=A0ABR6CIL4_9BACI|nr:hypothetical protein [Peribacillus huizhouensis]MBA9024889.1 hypothetical protein [Peribacillus huizhouensis]
MQPIQLQMQTRPSDELQQKGNFHSGQILLGKLTKLFPNNLASVQIGSQLVMATLDVPLTVGERYWLQVQPGEGQVRLKLLEAISSKEMGSNKVAEQLLTYLFIGNSKEAAVLVDYFLKNQLPITKETIGESLEFVKHSSTLNQGLSIIKTMLVQELPFVNDVFMALHSVENGKPLHLILSTLFQNLLTNERNTPASVQTKALLETLVRPKEELIALTGMQKILSLWLKAETPANVREGAYTLLQSTGLIPNHLSESELLSAFLDKILPSGNNNAAAVVRESLSYLSSQEIIQPIETNDILSQLNQLLRNVGERHNQHIPSFTKTLLLAVHANFVAKGANNGNQEQNPVVKLLNNNPDIVKEASSKIGDLLLKTASSEQIVTEKMDPQAIALKYILQNEFKVIDFSNAGSLSFALKKIMSTMGLGFEYGLATENQVSDHQLETLKPLLMKLLQDDLPVAVKNLAEQAIQRITAQQILAQENGPLQQLLLQIPLTMGTHQTDLTMQWMGRRKNDGTIDPAYCRIIFYLELESLEETIIDMSVQNRVINVSIIHEHPDMLEELATPFIAVLKKNLAGMDYKLSSIVFDNETKKAQFKKMSQTSIKLNDTYNGLDLRI